MSAWLFLPLASLLRTFLLRYTQKSKFWDLLVFWIFSVFSYLSAAVVDLLLGLLPVEEFPRKHYRDGEFLAGSTQCSWGKFCSKFFTPASKHVCAYAMLNSEVSLGRSFPAAELDYRWCQFWLEVMMSIGMAVTGSTGINVLKIVPFLIETFFSPHCTFFGKWCPCIIHTASRLKFRLHSKWICLKACRAVFLALFYPSTCEIPTPFMYKSVTWKVTFCMEHPCIAQKKKYLQYCQ